MITMKEKKMSEGKLRKEIEEICTFLTYVYATGDAVK